MRHTDQLMAHANERAKAKDWRSAISAYSEVIRRGGSTLEVRFRLGNCLLAAGMLREAILEYRSILQQSDCHLGAMQNLAHALDSMGSLTEASAWLERALVLSPDNCDLWNNFGVTLAKLGEQEGARRAYVRALDLDRSNPMPYHNLGNLFRKDGRLAEALQAYRGASARAEHWSSPRNGEGLCYLSLRRYTEAIAPLSDAVKLEPENREFRCALCFALYRAGVRRRATEEYALLLRIEPHFLRARIGFGLALLSEGKRLQGWSNIAMALPGYRLAKHLTRAHVGSERVKRAVRVGRFAR